MPPVRPLRLLDVGCGEGKNSVTLLILRTPASKNYTSWEFAECQC
ncbi:hypothetical protein [Desulfocucumis palustris]|nr:hypothetical protein [Desulfocucumis palustris]